MQSLGFRIQDHDVSEFVSKAFASHASGEPQPALQATPARTIIDMEGLRVALEYGQKCRKVGVSEFRAPLLQIEHGLTETSAVCPENREAYIAVAVGSYQCVLESEMNLVSQV